MASFLKNFFPSQKGDRKKKCFPVFHKFDFFFEPKTFWIECYFQTPVIPLYLPSVTHYTDSHAARMWRSCRSHKWWAKFSLTLFSNCSPPFNCISWLWTTVFYGFLSRPKKFRTQNLGGKTGQTYKAGGRDGVGYKRTTKDEIVTQSIP